MTADNGTTPVLPLEFTAVSHGAVRVGREVAKFKILHDESEVYTTEAVEKYP
jgi:hypothetical protein